MLAGFLRNLYHGSELIRSKHHIITSCECALNLNNLFRQYHRRQSILYPRKTIITVCQDTASAGQKMTDKSLYVLPNDQPVVALECQTAFKGLSTKEKLYAHYLSQASWNGGLIVLLQTSQESSLIFIMVHKLFGVQSITDLKKVALDAGLTEEEFQALLVYTSGIFTNCGNYKGFGDSKFIPNLPLNKFESLLKNSEAYRREPKVMKSLWERCRDAMYSLEEKDLGLGFSDKGTTTYYSANCTMKDAELVAEYMKKLQMEAYNTRVFKSVEQGVSKYEMIPVEYTAELKKEKKEIKN